MQSSPRLAEFIVQKNLPKQKGEQINNQKCVFGACRSFSLVLTKKDLCKYLYTFTTKTSICLIISLFPLQVA